jgi:hypothetical protein
VTDSMARLETLVAFLRNIAGTPDSLAPDRAVLREAYGRQGDEP